MKQFFEKVNKVVSKIKIIFLKIAIYCIAIFLFIENFWDSWKGNMG